MAQTSEDQKTRWEFGETTETVAFHPKFLIRLRMNPWSNWIEFFLARNYSHNEIAVRKSAASLKKTKSKGSFNELKLKKTHSYWCYESGFI